MTLLIIPMVFIPVSILWPSQVLAGRPLVVDDTEPVSQGNVEVELGYSYARRDDGGREQGSPAIALTYGLNERLELGLNLERVNDDPQGFFGRQPEEGF